MTTYSSLNFPFEFSRIVAEASMYLPPLTGDRDMEFMHHMAQDVMEIFWMNYVSVQPEDVQALYDEADAEETGEAILAWHKQFANFAEDENAVKLASGILADIAVKLPEAIKKEYEAFIAIAI